MEYYKKIDKSTFDGKITIPKKCWAYFINEEDEDWGSHREIKIKFKNKEYNGNLCFVLQAGNRKVLQFGLGGELVKVLKNEFIQSYIAIESQKLLPRNKKFHTELSGGNQEVITFELVDKDLIKMGTFLKVKTPYDNLFRRLVESNVFGWLSVENNKQMVTKYTKWIDIKDIKEHENEKYVVYYLADEKNKQLFIGSAENLGNRVKPGRKEIPEWNKFMYAIVHPQFHENLKEIEYHTIMSFAAFMNNSGNKANLGISDYTLVNKDYKYYRD